MRALMRSLAPTRFDDVAALVALYRPGPMGANMHNDYADRKNGRKPVEYFHPDAEELLGRHLRPDDLPGVSVMRVAQKFAGYSLAEADNLRKALRQEEPRADGQGARPSSWTGCERTGYGDELGTSCSTSSNEFADYAFNKSHSFGYGLIAYQTAYLKAHYPVEYFACLLTSVKSNLDKAAVYLAECRDAGHQGARPRRQPVRVATSPRCRSPGARWRRADGSPGAIPFGLSAVRNVGEGLVELLIARARRERAVRRLLRLLRARRPARCSTSARSSR